MPPTPPPIPLQHYLRLVQAHALVRRDFCALLVAAGMTGPCALATLLLASWEIEAARTLAWAMWPALAGGFFLGGPLASRILFRRLDRLARRAAPLMPTPELKAQFLPAVEFVEKGASDAFSKAHVASVEAQLAQTQPVSLVPAGRLAGRYKFAFAALMLSLSIGGFCWDRVKDGWSFIWNPRDAASQVAGSREGSPVADSPEPVTGGIRLTFVPPAYSGRMETTVPDSSGQIFALKGTEVRLFTRADRPVTAASLSFADGTSIPLTVDTDGRGLSGVLTVMEDATYRFRLVPVAGVGQASSKDKGARGASGKSGEGGGVGKAPKAVQGPPLPIVVEEDAPPTISMEFPVEDLVSKSDGQVTFSYAAGDDFGLAEVALVYRLPGVPKAHRIAIEQPAAGQRNAKGEYHLDLSPLSLVGGDELPVYLEAVDNDAMGGPKSAVTETRFIRIYSAEERHRQAVERLHQAWEGLVGLLGDRLESPDAKAMEPDAVSNASPSREAMARGREVDEKALFVSRELAAVAGRTLSSDRKESAAAASSDDAVGSKAQRRSQSAAKQEQQESGTSQNPSGEAEGKDQPPQGLASLDLEDAMPEHIRVAVGNAGEELDRLSRATSQARSMAMTSLEISTVGREKALKSFRKAWMGELAATERLVTYLENLLDEQRAEDLLSDAAELKAKRRQLASLLEELRAASADDGETRDRVFAEIDRLKGKMADLMRRMGELSRTIQDAHVNAEALKELDKAGEAMDIFDRMRESLDQGDVEGAMQALDDIASALDELEARLQDATGELGEDLDVDGALGSELKAFAESLDDLAADQEALLLQSKSARDRERQRRQKDLEARGEGFVEGLASKVLQARELVEQVRIPQGIYAEEAADQCKSGLDDLSLALKVSDLDRAGEFGKQAAESLDALDREMERQRRFFRWGASADLIQVQTRDAERMEKAKGLLDDVVKALDQLAEEAAKGVDEESMKAMTDLGRRQESLMERAGDLKERMGAINQSAPLFPEEALSLAEDIRSQMRQAAEGLAQGQPSRAVRGQQAAGELMEALKKGLEGDHEENPANGEEGEGQSSGQQSGESGGEPGEGGQPGGPGEGGQPGEGGEGGQSSGSSSGQGGKQASGKGGKAKGKAGKVRRIPWPWGSAPSRSGGGRDGGGGRMTDRRDEKIQIPKGAKGRESSEAYRRDILDAMKGRAPEGYREEVKHYYEEIVR